MLRQRSFGNQRKQKSLSHAGAKEKNVRNSSESHAGDETRTKQQNCQTKQNDSRQTLHSGNSENNLQKNLGSSRELDLG